MPRKRPPTSTKASKVPRVPTSLSLRDIYPPPVKVPNSRTGAAEINLNCCGNVDCGNYGVPFNRSLPVFKGPNAAQRRAAASQRHPDLATGRGLYRLGTGNGYGVRRESKAFEYSKDNRSWEDERSMICDHVEGNGSCEIGFKLLSNEHFLDEVIRLEKENGILEGVACGACGRAYLEAPEEFLFNGRHGRPKTSIRGKKSKPAENGDGWKLGVRLIHKPCRGKPGARFTVSPEHVRQKERYDNMRILRAIVSGSGMNDLRRMLADQETGLGIGMSRIYNRIFWLERMLVAFEKAQLQIWEEELTKKRDLRVAAMEAAGETVEPYHRHIRHNRIAHDDIALTVNWETKTDRKLTILNCSVSADIDSGYIFRVDFDFDPSVDPARFFRENYLDDNLNPKNLRREYIRPSGKVFRLPLLATQRPSGRFDEEQFFGAVASKFDLFRRKIEALTEEGTDLRSEAQNEVIEAAWLAKSAKSIGQDYFGLPVDKRDHRAAFGGMMVRDVYAKAASLNKLRETLPFGRITLVGEQEGTLSRVVSHIFRDEILEDRFEWHVIGFHKEATKEDRKEAVSFFKSNLEVFKTTYPFPDAKPYQVLTDFFADKMRPAVIIGEDGGNSPDYGQIFRSKQYPRLWVRSPVHSSGEIYKKVGFMIVSKRWRKAFKDCQFDVLPTDPEVRRAMARRGLRATLQPASTFMNALRERVSPARRAGGRGSARSGDSFISGAAYNPRVLMAIINIFRIYYYFFEPRPYVSPTNARSTVEVAPGFRRIKLPGKDGFVVVPKQRKTAPKRSTPAQRLGMTVIPPTGEEPLDRAPALHDALYRPWLYHGTPLFEKLEERPWKRDRKATSARRTKRPSTP